MPYPTRNGLNVFKTLKNGIKYTKIKYSKQL